MSTRQYTETTYISRTEWPARACKIKEDVFLHAKRLALTAGSTTALAYLRMKGLPDTSDTDDEFLMRLAQSCNRDDLKMSKCAHCAFRKKCCGTPVGCRSAIDDRTPIWKVAFTFYAATGRLSRDWKWITCYDRGWAKYSDGEIRQVSLSDMDLFPVCSNLTSDVFINYDGIRITRVRPCELDLVKCGVLPLKGETYEGYLARIEEIKQTIASKDRKKEDTGRPVEERLHAIFVGIGQGDALTSLYGNDAVAMARDYFPGMKPEEIANQYRVSTVKVSEEDVRKAAIEQRKAAGGGGK